MQRIILAVLATSFGLAGSAQAQRQHPVVRPAARWVINGHSSMALGTSVTDAFNEVKTSSGLGAGIEIGYRVTPRLLTYAGLEINKQPVDGFDLEGDFGLTHLEAGARLSFPMAHSKMMPYVGAWVGLSPPVSFNTPLLKLSWTNSPMASLRALGMGWLR